VTISVSTTGVSATNLNGGTLALANNNALGAGALVFTAGTLQAAASFPANTTLTLANAVTFTNSVATFAGANPILFNGGGTTGGGYVTLGGTNNLISVVNTGGTILAGQVINGATAGNLSKLGSGTLFLTNSYGSGASTFTGQTTVVA